MKKLYRKIATLFVSIASAFSLTGCDFLDDFVENFDTYLSDFISVINEATGTAIDWLTHEGKDGLISAFNTAKDGAVYVYEQVESYSQTIIDEVSEKAQEIAEQAKEYFENLNSDNITGYTEYNDYEPYATAASEMAANYFVSEQLSKEGYQVFNGLAYFDNRIYGGLIFTNDEYFQKDGSDVVYSCGFLQLASYKYDQEVLDDSIVEQGVIAVSYDEEGNLDRSYVVKYAASFKKQGIIYEDVYVEFEQKNPYLLGLSFYPNNPAQYASSNIDVTVFKTGELLYQQRVYEGYDAIKEADPENFAKAIESTNAIAEATDLCESDISSYFVLSSDLIKKIENLKNGGSASEIQYVTDTFGDANIEDNPVTYFDDTSTVSLEETKDSNPDSVRMAKGITTAIASALAAVGTTSAVVATVAFSVVEGVKVIPFIVITVGACAIVYNVSNMIAGVSDVYYGSNGSTTEAFNPVLLAFKSVIKNDQLAELVYHIWGISNTVIAGLMNPVAKALHVASIANSGFFATTGLVIRAVFIALSKIVITGVGAGLVSKFVEYITVKITGSKAAGILLGFASGLVAGMFIYKGLDNFDKQLNISGIYPDVVVDTQGVSHYLDDNLHEYRTGNELVPNNSYTIDGITYETNSNGAITRASGNLGDLNTGKRQNIRDSMDVIGRGDQQPTDDRGHIVGDYLGGSNGLENIVPQNYSLNRGEYRALEAMLASMKAQGKTVSIDIQLLYQNGGFRPTHYIYQYIINGVRNSMTFFNI